MPFACSCVFLSMRGEGGACMGGVSEIFRLSFFVASGGSVAGRKNVWTEDIFEEHGKMLLFAWDMRHIYVMAS